MIIAHLFLKLYIETDYGNGEIISISILVAGPSVYFRKSGSSSFLDHLLIRIKNLFSHHFHTFIVKFIYNK